MFFDLGAPRDLDGAVVLVPAEAPGEHVLVSHLKHHLHVGALGGLDDVPGLQADQFPDGDGGLGDVLVRYLQTFSGIGRVTSWVIRAEIGCFDRFQTGKQLSRFCGLSPRNASSGHRQADAGLIKAGNSLLRATLIEAAHRLERWDPRWHAFGCQLRQRGKAGSVVAAAIANRWLRWLFHQAQPSMVAA